MAIPSTSSGQALAMIFHGQDAYNFDPAHSAV
jgi:hypothetical protein